MAVDRALHAFVTGVLIGKGLDVPSAHGNWPHSHTPVLIRRHFKASTMRNRLVRLFDALHKMRVEADYGDHRLLDLGLMTEEERQLGIVLRSTWEK